MDWRHSSIALSSRSVSLAFRSISTGIAIALEGDIHADVIQALHCEQHPELEAV